MNKSDEAVMKLVSEAIDDWLRECDRDGVIGDEAGERFADMVRELSDDPRYQLSPEGRAEMDAKMREMQGQDGMDLLRLGVARLESRLSDPSISEEDRKLLREEIERTEKHITSRRG